MFILKRFVKNVTSVSILRQLDTVTVIRVIEINLCNVWRQNV